MLRLTCIATLAFLALLAGAQYLVIDRTIFIARSSAIADELTQREQMLSVRIAMLAGHLTTGDPAARRELAHAIAAFETTHAQLIAGDAAEGITSIIADPNLKALYFAGPTPLDASATQFVTRARNGPESGVLAGDQHRLDALLNTALRLRREQTQTRLGLMRETGFGIAGLMVAGLLVASVAGGGTLLRLIRQLESERERLAELAALDPLTGTLNRRSFDARGAIEVHKARRYQRPLSLMLIDADQLPMIENAYGSNGGETLLKALTSSVCAGTRMCDLVARVKRDQFAVLLPETDRQGAKMLAERLRRRISDLSVPIADSTVSCTVSIGVAVADKDASFLWPILQRADQALYEAQMRGRNQVCVAA